MRKAVNTLKTTTDLTDLSVIIANTLVLAANDFKFTFIRLYTLFFTIATLLSKNMSLGMLLYKDISLSFFPPVWVLASAAVSFSSLHPSTHSTGKSVWKLFLTSTPSLQPPRISQENLSCYCAELFCDLSMSFMKYKMGCMHKTGEIDNYLLTWMCPYLRSHRAQ